MKSEIPNNQDSFDYFRQLHGEIGYVDQILQSVVYISGLPSAHLYEKIIFESGDIGYIISISQTYSEVLMLTHRDISVGSQAARTAQGITMPVGDMYLGKVTDPLGVVVNTAQVKTNESRAVDLSPEGLSSRSKIIEPLETGVPIVDLVVPLARGQRELVIGDRKTGKTSFLLQTAYYCVNNGYKCIYAAIGKRNSDIVEAISFFQRHNCLDKVEIIASTSSDPAGLIYITPFSAMTTAEYFRDRGEHVLLILDDLTNHAHTYREIMLMAKKFPGRNSYPGDIFYTHARLLERAGNFKKGSISCLPVCESIMGDLSGYIQTNLMAITDGHIFFDVEIFNEGRRPAINPYLSVTRVGEQTQRGLVRDVSRELNRFLIYYQRLKQIKHFGSEMAGDVRKFMQRGDLLMTFFDQAPDVLVPLNLSIYLLACIWIDYYKDTPTNEVKSSIATLLKAYEENEVFRNNITNMLNSYEKFKDLIAAIGQRNLVPSTILKF